MKVLALVAALTTIAALVAGDAAAQTPPSSPSPSSSASASPSPTQSPTPPVTTVPAFPSAPHYLRGWPGPEEDSWYIYASGFTPRTSWVMVEVACAALPCPEFGASFHDMVQEEGTMSFYIRLSRAADPSRERLLAVVQEPLTGGGVPADAPSIRVAGHNAGHGFGYPAGTRTGIAAVDDVIALSQARDTAGMRARLVLKDGTTTVGTPVHGLAWWQCQPGVMPQESLDQVFEYPAALVFAVFRVPDDPALSLRYRGAAYGISWYDDGGGLIPLGGLTLVSASGMVVGTEIRCGTTPGFHVHNFTDFILPPFEGTAPVVPTVTAGAPRTGTARNPMSRLAPTWYSSVCCFLQPPGWARRR